MSERRPAPRPRWTGRPAGLSGLTLALVTLLACATGGDAPDDLAVAFGEGGGITGRWHGYAIQPGGTVTEWEGPGLGSRAATTPVGTLDAAAMAALWKKIGELRVLQNARAEYGSMSRAMLLTASGTTDTLAWPTPVESDTLTAAQKLYAFCLALATDDVR